LAGASGSFFLELGSCAKEAAGVAATIADNKIARRQLRPAWNLAAIVKV
jgi:hypothetical protein